MSTATATLTKPETVTKPETKPETKPKGKPKRKGSKKGVIDFQLLYQASVQSVDADLDFAQRVYKKKRGTPPELLREDFCGTAWLACEWVKRKKTHRAWGVDIHQPTLDWARSHNLAALSPKKQERISLIREDVRKVREPKVDVVMGLNFSYFLFKEREQLREYFRSAQESLKPGGMMVLDAFGGTEAMQEDEEERKIESSVAPDGRKVPSFTYFWDQARFNTVTNEILCHIHFRLRGGKKIRKAFSYDWRLWSLPELQELLLEAGFAEAEVYMDGWDDENDEADGIYRRRSYFENMAGWVAYVVGTK